MREEFVKYVDGLKKNLKHTLDGPQSLTIDFPAQILSPCGCDDKESQALEYIRKELIQDYSIRINYSCGHGIYHMTFRKR